MLKRIFIILIYIFSLIAIIMIPVDIVYSLLCVFFAILFIYLYKVNNNKQRHMYCIHCGKQIPEDSIYCVFCGKIVKKVENIEMPNNQSCNILQDNELIRRQLEYDKKLRKMEADYYRKLESLNERIKECEVVEPSELEIQITMNKIKVAYKENGFDIIIVDVRNTRYCTEYEIAFSSEYTQDDICSVSDKILEAFKIDGTNIKSNVKRIRKYKNHIIISVPFERKYVYMQ